MSSTNEKLLFLGRLVSPELNEVSILNGYLSIENGRIASIGDRQDFENYKKTIDISEYELTLLEDWQFLIPGFIDCHVHAPQFPNLGVGLDKPLLEWLEEYTFPLEKKYSDVKFAEQVYDTVVGRLIKNGTTTACYFGSLHLEGTLALVKSVARFGQRALVGKVSMNMENSVGYYNSTDKEIKDSEHFIKVVTDAENDLIEPVITPRFAISCDTFLMKQLGLLANQYNCKIQTHISENEFEVDVVLDIYKDAKTYTDVYDQAGLLNDRCILAHAIYLNKEEMQKLSLRGVSVAHCPASNTRLMSGMCPLTELLAHNIHVGLGTDVSAGDSASILDAARRSIDVSAHRKMLTKTGAVIGWKQALYMATMGGARALRLDEKIGDFTIGKDFDALLVNVFEENGQIDKYNFNSCSSEQQHTESLIQRFFFLGDDRNIEKVYVKGREIKQSL